MSLENKMTFDEAIDKFNEDIMALEAVRVETIAEQNFKSGKLYGLKEGLNKLYQLKKSCGEVIEGIRKSKTHCNCVTLASQSCHVCRAINDKMSEVKKKLGV